MTTTEKNKAFALFMGGEFLQYNKTAYWEFPKSSGNIVIGGISTLQYHSSFDWLIPVINKCREVATPQMFHLIKNIDKSLLELDILALYSNVFDFIEQYSISS